MERKWRVLLADDEPDMHMVTKLALKHKKFDGQGFDIVSALDVASTRELVDATTNSPFDVALVDLIMGSDSAGLEISDHLRAKSPATVVMLRTGNAGNSDTEGMAKAHAIDFVVPKTGTTDQQLYELVCKALELRKRRG